MKLNQTHLTLCDVTFDLLDPGMAVYHPNYLILADRARSIALANAGYSATELFTDGFALALRENQSEYFRPATMGQKLAILTRTTEHSASTLRVVQEMVDLSVVPADRQKDGYLSSTLEIDPKHVIHRVAILLVCVKLNPPRATRLPDRLKTALDIPGKTIG